MNEQEDLSEQQPNESVENTAVLPIEEKKSNAGRPTVMTPEVLELLRQAFLMGCTDVEACLYANISRTALNEYMEKNPNFRTEREEWKENPTLQARKTVYENIKDKQNAQWYLERKAKKEFSPRQELSDPDGEPLKLLVDPAFFHATPRQTETDSSKSSEVQSDPSGTQGGQNSTGSGEHGSQGNTESIGAELNQDSISNGS